LGNGLAWSLGLSVFRFRMVLARDGERRQVCDGNQIFGISKKRERF
jgi:hypothetical protein